MDKAGRERRPDALDWKAVAERRRPYKMGEVPLEVIKLTAGIDVQMRSLYYVIRGWGSKARSWLIDAGQLIGPTDKQEVWDQLTEILLRRYDGLHIERVLVDSGYAVRRLIPAFARTSFGEAFTLRYRFAA